MADCIKKIEGRAYARGYAAGRARVEKDIDREIAREKKAQRFDVFYAAAMQGLLACGKPWSRGDKPDKVPEDWADTAAAIAKEMMERAYYD